MFWFWAKAQHKDWNIHWDSEIVATPLCLRNILKDWTVNNMKQTGLNGYVYDFSVDYDIIAVDDILNIHN